MRRLLVSLLHLLLRSLLALAFALPALAQAKHPFTFEDMMKLKRVGDPQVSPDGKWVIFSVVDVDLEANTKTPHIWIVPLDAKVEKDHVGTAAPGRPAEQSSAGSSSPERKLIADQDADRPRWAPDGKHFAFLSTKESDSQVWIAEFDDAAGTVTSVHKLTSIATEAGSELWSPDGKNILFTSDVYPECDGAPDAETACDAKKLKEVEQSKVKAQIFDHLLYRHWNAYKEGKRSHIFVAPIDACVGTAASAVQPGEAGQGVASDKGKNSRAALDRTAEGGCPHMNPPRDLTPGDYDAPVFSLGGQDDYSFSPDGQEICYASNHDKNPAASTNNDLWIVPVNAGMSTDRVGADAFVRPASEASARGRFRRGVGQDRSGANQEHHRRQSGQRLDAALFARRPLHRLPRPAASGIRERPLSPHALRTQDRGRRRSSRKPLVAGSEHSSGLPTHHEFTSVPNIQESLRYGSYSCQALRQSHF